MTLKEQLKQMQDATIARMPQSIIKVFEDSIDSIRKDLLKEEALQIGDQVPNLNLQDTSGTNRSLKDLHTAEFLILNFYRGGWCPYCNMELREYERLRNEFNAVGADIIGISAEIPELANTTTNKNALSFPVLTDLNAQLMKAIGLVFQLDEASKKEYGNFGIDLNKLHGNNEFELPIPAVYVINKNLEIVFIHFEENYMTRMEPAKLLNIFKNSLITEKL